MNLCTEVPDEARTSQWVRASLSSVVHGSPFRSWEHTNMTLNSQLVRRFLIVVATSAAITTTIVGCGTDDGLGKRYPVSGTVTYNGKPLEKGEISFVTEDLTKNFGATGIIADGAYTLSTGGNDDGAQAGKYKVTIKAKEEYLAKAQADFQKDSGAGNPKLPPQYTAKAEAEAKSLIPAGYGDVRTTTLTAEVKDHPNTFNFELSDANAPPEPPKGSPAQSRGRKR
jgi:major membrane immunogen (membrane-anchored lipoprotein)